MQCLFILTILFQVALLATSFAQQATNDLPDGHYVLLEQIGDNGYPFVEYSPTGEGNFLRGNGAKLQTLFYDLDGHQGFKNEYIKNIRSLKQLINVLENGHDAEDLNPENITNITTAVRYYVEKNYNDFHSLGRDQNLEFNLTNLSQYLSGHLDNNQSESTRLLFLEAFQGEDPAYYRGGTKYPVVVNSMLDFAYQEIETEMNRFFSSQNSRIGRSLCPQGKEDFEIERRLNAQNLVDYYEARIGQHAPPGGIPPVFQCRVTCTNGKSFGSFIQGTDADAARELLSKKVNEQEGHRSSDICSGDDFVRQQVHFINDTFENFSNQNFNGQCIRPGPVENTLTFSSSSLGEKQDGQIQRPELRFTLPGQNN